MGSARADGTTPDDLRATRRNKPVRKEMVAFMMWLICKRGRGTKCRLAALRWHKENCCPHGKRACQIPVNIGDPVWCSWDADWSAANTVKSRQLGCRAVDKGCARKVRGRDADRADVGPRA